MFAYMYILGTSAFASLVVLIYTIALGYRSIREGQEAQTFAIQYLGEMIKIACGDKERA